MASQGDVIRCDVLGDFDGSELIMNTWNFQLDHSGGLTDAVVLTDLRDWAELLYGLIDYAFSVICVWRSIRAQNLTTGLSLGEEPFTAAVSGTGPGDAYAPGVAILANWNLDGANARSRKYFGPISEGAVSSQGNIQSTYAGPMASTLAGLTGAISIGTHDWSTGSYGGTPISFRAHGSVEVSSNPAYQRRRRRGRGA